MGCDLQTSSGTNHIMPMPPYTGGDRICKASTVGHNRRLTCGGKGSIPKDRRYGVKREVFWSWA